MVNGLFRDISEEEIMSVNGGCGGGGAVTSSKKEDYCHRCSVAKDIIEATNAQMYGPQDNTITSQCSNLASAVINLIAHAVVKNCEKNGHR